MREGVKLPRCAALLRTSDALRAVKYLIEPPDTRSHHAAVPPLAGWVTSTAGDCPARKNPL